MLVPKKSKIGAPSAKLRGIKWKPGNLACGKWTQWRGPQNHQKHEKYFLQKKLDDSGANFTFCNRGSKKWKILTKTPKI